MTSTVLTPPSALELSALVSRTAEVRACSCGQDLDACHAGHCPRCGVTLRG